MRRILPFFALAAFTSFGALGCARGPDVGSNLPLQKVVVYRNGIAYFERGGNVDEEEIHFHVKEGTIGDFLATLAVMEKGGSSVKSAAFPIRAPEDVPECDPSPEYEYVPVTKENDYPRLRRCTDAERRKIRDVVLSLDGKEHDLRVSYVTEAPVWRPSYRLVVGDNGKAEIQAWGIVQNLSGEDWKDVHLTLVSGAPLAFQATLGTPSIPQRPIVSDEGEVVSAVPTGETSLAQAADAAAPAAVQAQMFGGEVGDAFGVGGLGLSGTGEGGGGIGDGIGQGFGSGHGRAGSKKAADYDLEEAPKNERRRDARPSPKKPAGGGYKVARAESAPVAPPAPPSFAPSAPRNLRNLAAVAASGATTQFTLPYTVTVPDKSATMVLLLNKSVAGQAAWLFAPDGGVSDSYRHPFRVARFTNESGGTLEKGPIAVFEKGSFLGQGLVDPLPNSATASVPFALDRSIGIDKSNKYEEKDERVLRIEGGDLWLERDAVTLTTYKAKNGSEKAAKIYVKHPRQNGSRLEGAPAQTEDNTGTGSALVPFEVAAGATKELVVDERRSFDRQEGWFSPVAKSALEKLLTGTALNSDDKSKLDALLKLRAEILTKRDEVSALDVTLRDVEQQSEELRRNLAAIEKNKLADKLRGELTKRLSELATKGQEYGKRKVEIDAKLAELDVRFRDGTRQFKYDSKKTK